VKKKLPLRVKLTRLGEPQLADYSLSRAKIDTPESVFDFWQALIEIQPDHESEKENLVAISLNTRLYPISWHRVAVGSNNECVAHPREIFRVAIVEAAHAIIVAHNHPSGDPSPSEADRRLTQRLAEGASLLQIRLIDHIVIGKKLSIGDQGYFSFREAGLL